MLLTTAQVLERYSGGPQSGVFTDGSCIGNPGPGGWGAVRVQDGAVVERRHGADAHTTNNRMELTALIEGLSMLAPDEPADLYSDSRLVVDTVTKWAAGWERRGWRGLLKMFSRAAQIRPQCVEAMRELRIMNMRREKTQGVGKVVLKRFFRRWRAEEGRR